MSEKRTMSPAASSHPKRKKEDYDWRLTLATPQTFKTTLAIVEPTVANVPFQVCMEEDTEEGAGFTGLRMDAMNSSKVCMVKTAYRCQVDVSTVLCNPSFCVKTDILRSVLCDVDASHVVEITRYRDSDKLVILGYSADSSDVSKSEICLLHDDTNIHQLDMYNLTFNYVVEIELERLKKVCAIASRINSSVVEFSVGSDDTTTNYFTIHAEGDSCSVSKVYQSRSICTEGDETRLAVDPAVNKDMEAFSGCRDLETHFKGAFPTVYLTGVLKSMERQSIQLYMNPDMPLVLHYGLGDDMSYIKIVLAPRQVGV